MSSTLAENKVKTFMQHLQDFKDFGTPTEVETVVNGTWVVPQFTNEFWSASPKVDQPLHAVSYRACFKPQLPRFFFPLAEPLDYIFDPFMGRGTTLIEAALRGYCIAGADINPVSIVLTKARLCPPTLKKVKERLKRVPDLILGGQQFPEMLNHFYHPDTLRDLLRIRGYLLVKGSQMDNVDLWILMVCLTRMAGNSPGYFSTYTLPASQAVSPEAQARINKKEMRVPPKRNVFNIILKKSQDLLSKLDNSSRYYLNFANESSHFRLCSAAEVSSLPDQVQLTITSPPFLDVVDYKSDNWLRGWMMNINTMDLPIWQIKDVQQWTSAMQTVMEQVLLVTKPEGFLCMEVGEVKDGKVSLEQNILGAGIAAGWKPCLIVINKQEFSKSAAIYGVANNEKGTNSNRIVVFMK